MRRWRRASVVLVAASALAGCRAIPPPDILATLDQVRVAPATMEAKQHAPDVYAQGEKLQKDAREAFDRGDVAGAQIIGEQAMAVFEEAVAVARAVRAEEQRVAHAAKADAAAERLAVLEGDHQEVAAEIEALQQRLAVLDALDPLGATGPAKGARREARVAATKTLALQARLLCTAGDLLGASLSPKPAGNAPKVPAALSEAKTALSQLDEAIATMAAEAEPPLDLATRTRSACLLGLTQVRRSSAGGAASADALLQAFGDAKLTDVKASRDERGVTVTLHDVFADGASLEADAAATLKAVAAVGKRFPRAPVMVVLHQKEPPSQASLPTWQARGAAVVALLRQVLGQGRVGEATLGGDAAPLVDPDGAYAARNQRVDVVFVTPHAN